MWILAEEVEMGTQIRSHRLLGVFGTAGEEDIADKYKLLIFKIAKKLANEGVRVEFDELVQRGYLALLEAVNNFKQTRNRFTSYLYPCVEGVMRGEKVEGFTVSLNDEVGENDGKAQLIEFIPAHGKSPEDEAFSSEIAKALALLPPQERDVMRLRYQNGMTLKETGKTLGFRKQRAEQIEKQAIDRLRKRLRNGQLLKAA